jgi:hypothetical protein
LGSVLDLPVYVAIDAEGGRGVHLEKPRLERLVRVRVRVRGRVRVRVRMRVRVGVWARARARARVRVRVRSHGLSASLG